jgi:general secretion pathway protein D
VRRAQVLIEAIIAEVNVSDAKELGIQWISKGGAGIGITNLNGALPALIGSAGGDASSLANSFQGGVNFIAGKYDEGSKNGIGILINALNSSGNTNILSTPSILTLDNHEAEIVVGQEVPFITNKQLSSSNSNPFQNYERKDVGLKLKVKPQINNGSSIKLDISQEISNVMNSSSAADLITSKRTLNTSVMVEDGKMLVLGGLIDDTVRDSVAKVPLLGDVPLLGRLFSYNTKSKGKSNLMIFIRPTILKNQIVSDAVSMEKYNYIRAKQLLNDDKTLMKSHNAPKVNTQTIQKSTQNTVKNNTKGIHFTNSIDDNEVATPQQPLQQEAVSNIMGNSNTASQQKVQGVMVLQTHEVANTHPDGYLDKKTR